MIEPDGPLSLSRQCVLLGVSRSPLYYRPKGEGAENLALMRRMDKLHMEYPFYGSRQMMRHLGCEGVAVGRHRIRRLMRRAETKGIVANDLVAARAHGFSQRAGGCGTARSTHDRLGVGTQAVAGDPVRDRGDCGFGGCAMHANGPAVAGLLRNARDRRRR